MKDLEIYKENILELYKHPLNFKVLDKYDCTDSQINPSCGDDITIKIKFNDKIVSDIGVEGYGCAICIASTSLISEFCKDKTRDEVLKLGRVDIENLVGLPISPSRVRCSTLGLDTIQAAVSKYTKK